MEDELKSLREDNARMRRVLEIFASYTRPTHHLRSNQPLWDISGKVTHEPTVDALMARTALEGQRGRN